MVIKKENKIAIVGLGALFPDANNVDEFWQNIITKKISIQPLPENRLNSDVFYRPDLLTAIQKEDKTTTRMAAWIENPGFNTVRKYRIPPSVAEHMDDNQHAALYVVDQALGMNPLTQFASDRVAVIFGNGMVGTRYGDAMDRTQFQLLEHYARKHTVFQKLSSTEQEEFIHYLRENFLQGTIPISEDSAPGILPNLIAGRVANVFDYHGPSFTVDAACASVLAALIRGIHGLVLKEYDAVICGGSDMPLKDLGFILFSALNALSPDGSYPFDQRANGFVMGQGAGAITLKRLEDAIANQDVIYAVITGYGEASDGKGKYIAAPNAEWQARTIEKACRMAGYPVDTIELMEAHGTATRVGDVEEVNGLKMAFSSLGASRTNYCGLTSVKSNIGHLKSAAGIAGLIKAVLAIHHQLLPPTASFTKINPRLGLEDTPFYVLDELREWQPNQAYPRRANVSSFGFGGADYHIALEEYRPQDYSPPVYQGYSADRQPVAAVTQAEVVQGSVTEVLVYFAAGNDVEINAQVHAFLDDLRDNPEYGFPGFCTLHNHQVDPHNPVRMAFLAASPADLAEKHVYFQQNQGKVNPELLNLKGIYYKNSQPITLNEIAILFPGQASQYPGMFRIMRNSYDLVRNWFERGDAYWFQQHRKTISSLIDPGGLSMEAASEQLKQTQNAHPAIFLTSFALFQLLNQMGLQASYMIGHSLGEITALACAGKISPEQAIHLIDERGYAFTRANLPDPGKMISLAVSQEEAEKLRKASRLQVWVANLNSPHQTILAGDSPTIDLFKLFVDRQGIKNQLLQVSHAFHSPLMKPVAESFFEQIKEMPFTTSRIQVMMNHKAEYYPNTSKDSAISSGRIPGLLKDQILQPVRFIDGIQRLYADGVRLFIEAGPGSILSSLARDILQSSDARVFTSNFKNSDEISSLQKLCGSLFVEGAPVQFSPPRRLEIDRPVIEITQPAPARPIPETPKVLQTSAEIEIPERRNKTAIFYSGAAVGLPGSYKESFREDNFAQIFEGRNFIERLTDQERQSLVDLQISKLFKDESGPTFRLLTSLEDVIQLAGKAGRIDMIRDYQMDEKIVRNMTSCIALGVAVGYEALKDAHIPLVREYHETSTGSLLPQKLALPKEMQAETGVIFANGFPLIDPVIEEVSRYIGYQFGDKTRRELMSFYESIIPRVKDPHAKKLLSDWYTLYYSRLSSHPGEDEIYQFNHHFMTQISAQANNLLAMLINAKGPNFQMNAACSSTSNAITIAEDFIRSGRVKRMIVVGGDDPTSKTNLPILGAGFLCTGAATNEADLYAAAIPFDRRRNGMLMGAGAVGLVLETQEELEKRGVSGICELLGTHSFNTARHISQIDAEIFSQEFDKFISRMEREHGLGRDEIARNAIYISHEPCTPPRGGCSQTEVMALRTAFGKYYQEIIIGNSKGMTGHTMGASLEDSILPKSLQYGKCPPVVNLSEPDPEFAGLNFWRGGNHNRIFGLKLSAGFGSQGHLLLLRKTSSGDQRFSDPARYQRWLETICPGSGGKVELQGQILAVHDPRQAGADHEKSSASPASKTAQSPEARPSPPRKDGASKTGGLPAEPEKRLLEKQILEIISQVTTYPPEMLEAEMELGPDLGVDPSKQRMIRDRLIVTFNLDDRIFSLDSTTTIAKIVADVKSAGTGGESSSSQVEKPKAVTGDDSLVAEVLQVFSDVTKYPVEMLELDMEMEADLGIDTVKKATILSILSERYHIEQKEGMRLSDYPTIRHIVNLFAQQQQAVNEPMNQELVASELMKGETPKSRTESLARSDQAEVITAEVLAVFSEVTKYPVEMLELDMEMEADLGIDTVKKATILSILGERYRLQQQEGMKLSDYPTIRHIVNLVLNLALASQAPARQDELIEIEPAEPNLKPDGAIGKTSQSSLSRQVVQLAEEELSEKVFDLLGKHVCLLGDDSQSLPQVRSYFEEKGCVIFPFVFPAALTIQQTRDAVNSFLQQSAIEVVIDCSHIGNPVQFNRLSLPEQEKCLFLNSEARFIFYKCLSAHEVKPSRIICLVSIDGSLGFLKGQGGVTDPTYGALTGFYKSLRKEWPESVVRIVDFSPQVLTNEFSTCLDHLTAEIERAGEGVEICYVAGTRMAAKIVDKEVQTIEKMSFSTEDTFLITGGGTGLGARLALAVAQEYQAKLIIVDVVSLPENIEALASLDGDGLAELKGEIQAGLKRTNQRVTPVMVNKEFDAITRAIEVHKNLKVMEDFRSQVVYIPCDVRDFQKLERFLDDARARLGPITAIIHAAGLDRSHFIEQKNEQEFHDVFTVKAQGAGNLRILCQADPCRLVVVFGSISGRFGNAAQLDYSAANNYLSYWIRMIQRERPELNALCLVWSGWKDVGMAWRNELVRQRSEETGLNLIEVDQGLSAFHQEIEHRTDDREVILHRGLNGFVEKGLSLLDLTGFPLIDRIQLENEKVRAYRLFSIRRDALIDQHRLGSVPILPAVGYAELAVEFYRLLTGERDQVVLRDLHFANPFKLFREAPRELFIEGVMDEAVQTCRIEILSNFRPPRTEFDQRVVHARLLVTGENPDLSGLDPQIWSYNQAQATSLPAEESLQLLKSEGPEQRIILGPLYNDVIRESKVKEPVLIYPDGTTYPTYFPLEQLTNPKYPIHQLKVNPCFLDSLLQACAANLLVNTGRIYLPWKIGELGIVHVPRNQGLYMSYTQVIHRMDDVTSFNVVMLSGEGQICYYGRDVQFRLINL